MSDTRWCGWASTSVPGRPIALHGVGIAIRSLQYRLQLRSTARRGCRAVWQQFVCRLQPRLAPDADQWRRGQPALLRIPPQTKQELDEVPPGKGCAYLRPLCFDGLAMGWQHLRVRIRGSQARQARPSDWLAFEPYRRIVNRQPLGRLDGRMEADGRGGPLVDGNRVGRASGGHFHPGLVKHSRLTVASNNLWRPPLNEGE